MLDFGWTELLLIAVVAVVVIGPKDLPKAMAGLADWIRKLRSMASDFQGQVDDMVKGTELEDVRKAAQGLNRYNVKRQLTNTIDPKGQMKKALEETRQAVNARVDAPTPSATSLASSSEMTEAPPYAGDAGPALLTNEPAVRAVAAETPVPVEATPAPKAKSKSVTTAAQTTAAKTTAAKTTAAKTTAAKTTAAKAPARANGAGAAGSIKPARPRKKAAAGETGGTQQTD